MPILYLAIISSDISMPKGAVRDAFAKALPAMAELCATIDILILDRDIRATLIRTFVRAMALAVPGPKMHVFGSADQIAADWKKKYGVDAAAVLARFRVFEETKVA
jgi:hypothetical protein